MPQTPKIIWLASWYPTQLDPYPGDFIQRRAKALSLYMPLQVLHIIKDDKQKGKKHPIIEETTIGQLTETIIYYTPYATGVKLVDQLISTLCFFRLGQKQLKKMVDNAKAKQPILVDVHVAFRMGLLALWMKRKWKIPFSITEHWTGYYQQQMPPALKRNILFWWITKIIFKQAVFFRPETENLGKHINASLCKINYRVVPNVVDVTHFKPAIARPPNQAFCFIHVSTLGYQKNIEGILSVVQKIWKQNTQPPFTLRLIGPTPHGLAQKVLAHPILGSRVSFSGPIAYQQVAKELQAAHALLMFSRYENLPCVILEALCCGLPVISSQVGGIAEHINPSNGLLVNSQDEVALEKAMLTLLHQYPTYNPQNIAAQAQIKYNYQTVGNMLLANYQEFYPHLFYKTGVNSTL